MMYRMATFVGRPILAPNPAKYLYDIYSWYQEFGFHQNTWVLYQRELSDYYDEELNGKKRK